MISSAIFGRRSIPPSQTEHIESHPGRARCARWYGREMARTFSSDTLVDRTGAEQFIRPRHHAILSTQRADGSPQMSPVTMGLGPDGAILVASYPERAKVHNLRLRHQASLCVLSDDFGGEWIQVSGTATVVDLPDAMEGLVTYFRSISGEHPDWDDYRQAMTDQGKVLIRLAVEQWGPISKGGFPPRLRESSPPST
jgi:PPOX class probable F420-dependent enzyme